jgi:serine/threonine-protein kinase
MLEIRLPRGRWRFDPNVSLGPKGGFGAVYAGEDEQGDPVAVKQLHIDAAAAAHRELRMADALMQRSLQHVLPVLDAGQDAQSDRYYIVMPKADYSLRQELERRGALEDLETIQILQHIIAGLLEVQDITHRDLKPGNILLHEERWRIADFGIARFVEESTSLNTLRECLTFAYAAPEQLRLERATTATDVYALGCIAYTLLTGAPPFGGMRDEIVEQHLHSTPSPLPPTHLPELRNLASMMLRKPPQSRPSLVRIASILTQCAQSASTPNRNAGLSAVAQVGVRVAEESARAEAAAEAQRTAEHNRFELAQAGLQVLRELADALADQVIQAAPNARRNHRLGVRILELELGSAKLEIERFDARYPITAGVFRNSNWDVIAGAVIRLTQAAPAHYVWSANLWYMKWGKSEDYRWVEVSYMANPLMRDHPQFQPYAVERIEDADLAAARGVAPVQHAARPRPIDDENAEDFYQRWLSLFASAADGKLTYPSRLPLD